MARMLQALAAVALLLFGGQTALAEDKPRIVAVNYALQYFAQRLAGDSAVVVFPVPADTDPSFWRPSISDISEIQSSDLILLNGAGFATWIDRVSLPRSRVVNTSRAIEDQFIVTESITHSHGDGGEHSHEGLASYTWLNPVHASAQAEAVAAALSSKKIAFGEELHAVLTALKDELETLDARAKVLLTEVQDVPIIATHPRYQYFAERYGLKISYLEWEAGALPKADDLADLEELRAETGAGILIWEAPPPTEGVGLASELGFESIVFDPMAHAPERGDFLEAFGSAIEQLASAANVAAGASDGQKMRSLGVSD